MARIGLSSPWVTFYRELEALFLGDADVRVVYDEEANHIKLYVDGEEKAYALSVLLPSHKQFGNVDLLISIIPSNNQVKLVKDLYAYAFEGNSILSYIKKIRGIFTNDITYVVFRNVVVQYFNDDLSDVNGYCSTLYQDIAKRVFEEKEGVFFCTDLPVSDGSGKSLGRQYTQWP